MRVRLVCGEDHLRTQSLIAQNRIPFPFVQVKVNAMDEHEADENDELPDFEAVRDHLEVQRSPPLGVGAFGTVHYAVLKSESRTVAVKAISKSLTLQALAGSSGGQQVRSAEEIMYDEVSAHVRGVGVHVFVCPCVCCQKAWPPTSSPTHLLIHHFTRSAAHLYSSTSSSLSS